MDATNAAITSFVPPVAPPAAPPPPARPAAKAAAEDNATADAPDSFARQLQRATPRPAAAAPAHAPAPRPEKDAKASTDETSAPAKAAAASPEQADSAAPDTALARPADAQDAAPGADAAALLAGLQPALPSALPRADTARSLLAAGQRGGPGAAQRAQAAGDSQAATAAVGTSAAASGSGAASPSVALADRSARADIDALTAAPVTAARDASPQSSDFQTLLAANANVPTSHGQAAAQTATDGRLSATPGSPDFPAQLGAQLTTFVKEGVEHARLELHPVEMGPLTVQIQIDGQSAQISMSAEHGDTRQALEQAMPMLAGTLREAGLTLSGGGVFEQPRQPARKGSGDGADGNSDGRGPRGSGVGIGAVDNAALPASAPVRRRGVVDLVA